MKARDAGLPEHTTEKIETTRFEMITMLTDYERYQLEWMIEHGHSLKDFVQGLDLVDLDGVDCLEDAYAIWEQDYGFGGEIFSNEREFNEGDAPALAAAASAPASYQQAIAAALRKEGWSVLDDSPEPILIISRESPATGRTFLMTVDAKDDPDNPLAWLDEFEKLTKGGVAVRWKGGRDSYSPLMVEHDVSRFRDGALAAAVELVAETLSDAIRREGGVTLRDWYMRAYPEDPLGSKIKPVVTLDDVLSRLRDGGDFYDFVGVCDSVVRERVFVELCDRYGFSYDDLYDCWCNGVPLPACPGPETAFEECGTFTDHGFGFHAQRGTMTDYVIGWPFEDGGWAVLTGSYDLEDDDLDCHVPEDHLDVLLSRCGYSSLSDLRSVNGDTSRAVLTGIIARDQEESRFEVPHIFPDAASAARFCASLGVPEGRLLPAMESARAEYEMSEPSPSPENTRSSAVLDTPQAVKEALLSGKDLYNTETGEFWWLYNATDSIATTTIRLDDPNLLAVIDDPDFDPYEDIVGGLNYTGYITESPEYYAENANDYPDVPDHDERDAVFTQIASEDGWVVATPENVRAAVYAHMPEKEDPIGRGASERHGAPTTAELRSRLSEMPGKDGGRGTASPRLKV